MTTTPDAAPGPSALVIGEALIDIVRATDGTVTEHAGGSPMNVAVGLARLGHPVEFASWFGQDEHGALILDHLAADDVRLTPGTTGAVRTSTAAANLAADGQATYEFDLDWAPGPVQTTSTPLLVHTGSIAGVLTPGAEQVRATLADARSAAAVSYDPNARPSIMGEPAAARADVEALVALSDVVKVSDEDIAWLCGDESEDALRAVVRSWLDLGPGLVVVTRGGSGASAWTRGGVELDVASEKVTVADTVGAGDSFMAGLDDGLWRLGLFDGAPAGQRPAEALAALDAESLTRVLRRCARIAAITVSRPGANPPRLDELGADVAL